MGKPPLQACLYSQSQATCSILPRCLRSTSASSRNSSSSRIETVHRGMWPAARQLHRATRPAAACRQQPYRANNTMSRHASKPVVNGARPAQRCLRCPSSRPSTGASFPTGPAVTTVKARYNHVITLTSQPPSQHYGHLLPTTTPPAAPTSSPSSPQKALLHCNSTPGPREPLSHRPRSLVITIFTSPRPCLLSNQQAQQVPPPPHHHLLTPRRHPPGHPTSRHTWQPGSAPPQGPGCHTGTARATPAWPPAHAAQA